MGTHALDHELQNSVTSAMEALDSEEFKRQGYMIIDFIADYYKNIEKYPVLSQVQPDYLKNCLSKSAPYDPEPIETILEDTQRHILPGITHWQSPNYFAYFPSSCSIAGFLGETLSNGFNIAGFNWISSPAATELESIVMDWLGEMLKLPNSFLHRGTGGGVIHPTTCEAILSTLTAARDKILNKVGRNNISKLVVYGSDQTHSALKKAAQIAGIHEKNIRAIKTNISSSFELPIDVLKSTIDSDIKAGLIPTFLCATIGTTATNAVDRLGPLSNTVKRYGMWIHVDAAYAGSACICPEFRHFIDGVEGVDSFSLNAHKWFFTTQECCCLWLKNPNDLIKSLSTDPEYLKNKVSNSKQVIDYKDWQIGLTRKFRAMKLWLVLRNYGVRNLRNFIRSHINMAKIFEELVANDKRFKVVVPRNFSMVCFRALPSSLIEQQNESSKEEHVNELNRKLLESINATGKLFVTHAVVEGIYVIRFAIGATLTQEQHVRQAWTVVKGQLEAILSK